MFGKERTLVVSLVVLGLGTLVAALASSIELLIVGRVIQGAGGAVFPLAFGIIRDEFPRERVARGIAFLSALLGIGGGAGIILAGPIVDALSYHWLFWFPLVMVVIAVVATILFVPESPIKTPGRINWLGAALLAGWLIALLIGVSEGPEWGWTSGRTLGLFAASAVLLVVWIAVESRAAQPLVDMGMMRLRGVWTTNTAALLIGFGMYSSFVLVPQYVQMPSSTGYGFGATATEAGLFLFPATLAMLLVSPIAGRLSSTVGSKVPLVLGAAVSAGAFALLATRRDEHWQIYLATALLGAGIGLAFASMANLIVEAVPREQTGVAGGMNTIMRSIGGAVGAQVSASVVTASAGVSGLPEAHGWTDAFTLCSLALVGGLLVALAVPARRRAVLREPVLER
jgi:EmrB/QacA subfamily drug resistance transporter